MIPVAALATTKDILFNIYLSNDITLSQYHKVSFDTDGGTPSIPDIDVKHNETITQPADPTKDHYTFKGWQLNNTDYNFSTPVTGGVTLKASYTPTAYTISYNLNGGTVATTNPTTYNIETNTFTLNNPTKSNHIFKGWIGSNGTNPEQTISITKGSTGDKTYEAVFIPVYTITYDTNGGTVTTPSQFTKENGEQIGDLATPTRDHYTFGGWYIGNTLIESNYTVSNNITLTAKWTPITYNISYNLNGGTVTTANPTTYNIETNTFTLNNPTKDGYKFTGWTGSNGTTAQTDIEITKGAAGDKEYTANWVKLYIVTFNPERGQTPEETRIVEEGAQIGTLPTPTKEGHDFKGWWTAETGGTRIYASQTITEDVTYYAHFEPKYYSVNLITNDDNTLNSNYARFNVMSGGWVNAEKGDMYLQLMYRYSEADKKYVFVPSYTYIDEEDTEITTAASYIEPVHCMADFVKWVDKDGNEYTDDSLFHTFEEKNKSLTAVWDYHDQYVASPGNFAQAIKNIYNDSTKNMLADDDPNGDLRYYGVCVNNRVQFNGSLWNIVGVFDVDDGNGNIESRVKLIATHSYGSYPKMDVSDSSINGGKGINQWGESTYADGSFYEGADLMRKLNIDYLNTANYTTQYHFMYLNQESLNLIDNAKWYTGAVSASTPVKIYQQERGNSTGNNCTRAECNDTVNRTTTWVGKVGLPNPSDYPYSSAGRQEGREACLAKNVRFGTNLQDNTCDFAVRSWLVHSGYTGGDWTLNPYSYWYTNSQMMTFGGYFIDNSTDTSNSAYPVVYLKPDVKLTGGIGLRDNPYIIEAGN